MKKGFTLIELLAVIVILAILALIVSPIISGVISDAKKAAAERSMEGYVKAVEFAQVEYQGKNKGSYAKELTDLTINYSGNTVSNPVTTFEQGIVKHAEADITTFHCVYDKGSGAKCDKTGTTVVVGPATKDASTMKPRVDFEKTEEEIGISYECYYYDSECPEETDWDAFDEYLDNFYGTGIDVHTINSVLFTNIKRSGNIGDGHTFDISVGGDGSVILYAEEDSDDGTRYDVYIYSAEVIKAPKDSEMLFKYLDNATSINLNNMLDTSKVTDMSGMFYGTGFNSDSFTLNLGNEFDTSNVTNMSVMFAGTGFKSDSFTLNLGNKFDTSKVTNMSEMFCDTGYKSDSFTLNLGDKFDTSNVFDMSYMFKETGYNSDSFTLNLGDKFDTSKVTNMSDMFCGTGYTAMSTLDLGTKFTNIASNNNGMFEDTGAEGCVIKAPSSIYQDSTHFKLNSTSSVTIEYTRGNIIQR